MKYISSKEIAKKWNISERSVRNYCNEGRVIGAYLDGKTWMIPVDALKPERKMRHITGERFLLQVLSDEMEHKTKGGIYHKLQIEMTYNSNHMEGSHLSHEQTRYIFETKTIGVSDSSVSVDDIIETTNHFACIDLAIQTAKTKLSESLIKQFHYILKSGTSDSRLSWFKTGDYKIMENEAGGNETIPAKEVRAEMKKLIMWYNSIKNVTLEDIIEFHFRFETIHPFQDGNGRVGRLIMLKECLKHDIVPVIITEEYKMFYYRGLKEWNHEKGYLLDTCLTGQDLAKTYLDYFKIKYAE